MAQQPPNKLPLNFELLNHIVMTSKYIPETKRNAYLTNIKIQIKVSIMAYGAFILLYI